MLTLPIQDIPYVPSGKMTITQTKNPNPLHPQVPLVIQTQSIYTVDYHELMLKPPYAIGDKVQFPTFINGGYYQFDHLEVVRLNNHYRQYYAIFLHEDMDILDKIRFEVLYTFKKEKVVEVDSPSWWSKLLC
jgi:hypothetical protein